MWFPSRSPSMPSPERALPGRAEPMPIPERHFVNGAPLTPPWPEGTKTAIFGLGCFWGAEKAFWTLPGVVSTAVGYAGGYTPNPTYREACSGKTGHAEVVLVAYDPSRIAYEELLRVFWESHDPTQGMRQGNDVGTQYRSAVHTTDAEQTARGGGLAPRVPGAPRRGRLRPDHDGDPRGAGRSTTPRTTTSSTWPRTRTATAPTTGRESRAPSASASRRRPGAEPRVPAYKSPGLPS